MASVASQPGFRNDINGLRAWAVVAVVLYHFAVPGFGGGFVGVDVFFVISGFLMTGIVIKGLEQGSFSVLAFYGARARRIVPALLVLCGLLLATGYVVLAPPDYKNLATHAISALGFFSNFKFWDEAGYFDTASHDKWLLHTWSLSVEWQFYLLLPIVLSLVWRLKPGRLAQILLIGAGIVLSFGLSAVLTDRYPSTAFYLLPTRAWEMLCGGLVFMFSAGRTQPAGYRRWIEALGLLLIIGSATVLDVESPWPGWRAALPVIGAMLVLQSNRPDSLWTGNRIVQWLGDRSYSLYLWHWPLVVALAYAEMQREAWAIVVGMMLTVGLGDISCRWVENPSRRGLGRLSQPRFLAALTVAFLVVLAPAVTIRLANGFPGRLDPLVESVAKEANNFNRRRDECHVSKGNVSPSCIWGGKTWNVIALGDSHTSATVSALAATRDNAGVVQWSYSGCSFVSGLKIRPEITARAGANYQCERFVEWAESRLTELPPNVPVVILNRYAEQAFGTNAKQLDIARPEVYFSAPHDQTSPEFLTEFAQHIRETACKIAKHRRVYLVRPIPEMGFNVPRTLSRRLAFGMKEDVAISIEDYRRRNDWVWAGQDAAARECGATILDPTPYLCDAERCYGSRNLQPLYMDDNHLSETGNKLLTPMYQKVFDERSQ
jgi:peptidoglycan/LPS O-acetylase OafA/YrhL